MTTILRSLVLGAATLGGLGAGLAGLATVAGPGDDPDDSATPAPPAIVAQDEASPSPEAKDDAAESAPNLAALRCPVEGTAVISFLCPDGTPVVAGQLVCKLDDSDLQDRLKQQQIVTERAKFDYENAKKNREVTEINLDRYKDVIAVTERQPIEGEIRLGRAVLDLARLKLDRAEKLLERQAIEELAVKEAEVDVLRAELDLERAEQRLRAFEASTYPSNVRSLEGDVEKAEAELLAKQSTFELEKEKEQQLRQMIERCQIEAPIDGLARCEPGIVEGAEVRQSQVLVTVAPTGQPSAEDGRAPNVGKEMLAIFVKKANDTPDQRMEILEPLFRLATLDVDETQRAAIRARLDEIRGMPLTDEEFDALVAVLKKTAAGTVTDPER